MKNYYESALMSIRRLCDTHRDSTSLMKLLKELQVNPEKITLDFYRRNYQQGSVGLDGVPDSKAWTYAMAEDAFREKFGGGGEILMANVVEADVDELTTQTSVIEKFIDNTLAHHNKGDKGVLSLETKHVRQAIETIEKIAIKYIDLMGMGSYSELTPVYQYDPEEIFTKAWINK